MRPPRWHRPDNASAWALCRRLSNGHIKIRTIVWGLTMAKAERREHEIIQRADIHVLTESNVSRETLNRDAQ